MVPGRIALERSDAIKNAAITNCHFAISVYMYVCRILKKLHIHIGVEVRAGEAPSAGWQVTLCDPKYACRLP